MKPTITVCASGGGSLFTAIHEASRQGTLAARVGGLITNNPKAAVFERAQSLGVSATVLSPKAIAEWDQAMVRQLEAWHTDWVVLAGFLVLIGPRVLARFPRRIVNIHPALLPKYGGPGMYGNRVHEAVLKAGERATGSTVHFIDQHFDRGEIVAQEQVPVTPDDTAESLAERVKALELSFYPRVLNDLVTGKRT